MSRCRLFLPGLALLLILTGCGFHATRYTWVGDETKLPQVNLACARDIQKAGPVEGAAKHNPFTGKLVGGAVPTLYKDCVARHGYLRTKIDDVALVWDEPLRRWRPDPTCGKADQTCLWVEPNGEVWGIAPLPAALSGTKTPASLPRR
jgi:hypothetical protein